MLKKWSFKKFGHTYYFLGVDAGGDNYFLENATFNCGWYWGGGYVETFTNNRSPELARDIKTHTHFDSLFLNNPRKIAVESFKEYFTETPFTDSEIWKICELMKSFYIMRNYSDMIYRGGANYTHNPASEIIKSETEYKRINEIVIPEIMTQLYEILKEG